MAEVEQENELYKEIADFCGCSRETIRRIEKQALEKLKGLLG